MKYPHIDKRTKEDLLDYIKKTAQYYSEEWRFNEEDMDMGSVLATIFVNMFKDTIDRFNEVPYKNFITFLNIINAKLLPSISAKGYITFNLVKGINEGVIVKKGEKLSAKADNSERIIFQTEKNIYVTPAKINYIFNSSFRNDSIIKIYDYEEEGKSLLNLFSTKGENLQRHEIIIQHKEVLNLRKKGQIEILLDVKEGQDRNKTLEILSSMASWSYLNGRDYIPLESVINNGSSLIIKRDFSEVVSKEEEINKNTLGILKCEIDDIKDFKALAADKITLKSNEKDLLPDIIFCKDLEGENKGLYPFSERFSVYDDFYISSKEAFLKKQAHITISFNMEFIKVPIETYTEELDIDWKYIMKKSAFKKPEEYEISIAEVIWEYWNGLGWAKLKTDMDYSKVFSFEEDYQKRRVKLQFICPDNIKELRVHSYEGVFIRARVLRVNNQFRIHGYYIAPYIEQIRIDYEYLNEMLPEEIKTLNNMVNKAYGANYLDNEDEKITIFERTEIENNICYFAFDKKIEGSPIRILFQTDIILPIERPILIWEYWNGKEWRRLSVVDETESMRKSGIVSFSGEADFEKKTLFNKDMYWIRIYNSKGEYEADKLVLPVIKDIFINTVQIVQEDSKAQELFSIDAYEKNKTLNLIHKNINRAEVWVNEHGEISKEEILNLSKNNRKIIRSEIGEIEEVWVKWEEAEDLILANKNDRCFLIDKNNGQISFGDGINGKIPRSNKRETIKVIYSVGGGERGNLATGQIKDMERSIGYINKIFNPIAAGGGSDIENIDDAVNRIPLILKNRNRAVTSEDYENIVREGCRNISKVKCFYGVNYKGEREPGDVTIVMLPKVSFEDSVYFDQLRSQVKSYLNNRNLSFLNKKNKVNIIQACFINISVMVEVEAEDMDMSFSLKQEIEDALIAFIDPMKGNFNKKGWEIGEFPVREKIINCLKNIDGVKRISKVIISTSTNNEGKIEDIDIMKFKKRIFGIPVNGVHKIELIGENLL